MVKIKIGDHEFDTDRIIDTVFDYTDPDNRNKKEESGPQEKKDEPKE